jgi:hypothetical protein
MVDFKTIYNKDLMYKGIQFNRTPKAGTGLSHTK